MSQVQSTTAILATDVKYHDDGSATAAGVLFSAWSDRAPLKTYTVTIDQVEDYESGLFYKRELPCLLALWEVVEEAVQVIVVDGHVDLGKKPGMGRYLYNALHGSAAVVGVAKRSFRDAGGQAVCRSGSTRPLHVTAAGMPLDEAVRCVVSMHGPYRMPTLLKLVDSLSRGHV